MIYEGIGNPEPRGAPARIGSGQPRLVMTTPSSPLTALYPLDELRKLPPGCVMDTLMAACPPFRPPFSFPYSGNI